MGEKMKEIPERAKTFWNKFTSKQKTIIISVVMVVLFAVVVLSYSLTRTQYQKLIACENAKEASEIVDLLKAESYKYKLSGNSTIISVDKKKYSDALMLLGKNDIPALGYTFQEAINNSFSTTSEEKKMKYNVYLQDYVRQTLLSFEGVKDAVVHISAPEDDNTILSEKEDTSVSVVLTVTDKYDVQTAETMANVLAGAVNNKSTEKITIADQDGNCLFLGSEKNSLGGTVTSNNDFKSKLTATQENRIYKILVKMPNYDDAEIVANFKFDMDKVKELYTQYTPAEGESQGVLKSGYTYKSKGASTSGGVPGTASNDGTTSYDIQTDGNANSQVDVTNNSYAPNEKVTETEFEIGAIMPEQSSIAINLTNYKTFKEEELKKQGLLEGITFDEFIAQNSEPIKLEVDPDVYAIVKAATGIDTDNIIITAWETHIFQAQEKKATNFSNILMIVLAVLIIGLLIFVVFKGVAPVEVTELEPELSVEQLLATTKENQSLEDIEFTDKSETRKMIEKFVDENPEAVAQLLRNWLNEDWG